MKNLMNAFLGGKEGAIGLVILAVLILLVMPMFLDIFRLNLMGKYLTFAFVAIGLVLCWGHGGILSLGQGIFFGIGGYCMAMFLKLEASSVENTSARRAFASLSSSKSPITVPNVSERVARLMLLSGASAISSEPPNGLRALRALA